MRKKRQTGAKSHGPCAVRVYSSAATFEECATWFHGVQAAYKTRCFIMYTSISGSGRPSPGVCSLDYAAELHKRGIQRVKVRVSCLRRGRGWGETRRVCRGDFQVPFPLSRGAAIPARAMETRRNERSFGAPPLPNHPPPAEIKFRLNGSPSAFCLPPACEKFRKKFRASGD